MRTKSQQVKAAKKKGLKAQKRRAKVEAKRKFENSLPSIRVQTSRGVKRFFMRRNPPKEAGQEVKKVEAPPKQLPPYRISRLQAKVERLQAGIRATDMSDPKRAKMVERLNDIKRKLGK